MESTRMPVTIELNYLAPLINGTIVQKLYAVFTRVTFHFES
jgi:hypothetical protein